MDYFWTTLNIWLFVSIPQTFIHTWLACLVWGIRPQSMFRRLLLFSATVTALFDIAFLALPTHLHMINANIIYFLTMFLMFRELKTISRMLVQVTMSVTIMLSDSILLLMDKYAYAGLLHQLKTGHLLYKAIWVWPILLALGLLCLFMHKRKISPAHHMRQFMQRQRRPYIFAFVLLLSLQLTMFILYLSTRFLTDYDELLIVLFYLGIVTIAAVSAISVWLLVRTRDEAIRSTQQAYVGDLLQMVTTIRGQRHDFINHVQVMYSLLKMNKQEQLRSYMEEVVEQVQIVSALARQIPTPALSALVQAKSAIAIDKRITFSCHCSDLPEELPLVKSVDLVRIIGNLIDNAFDAVAELPEPLRAVKLEIRMEQGVLTIRVANHGTLTEHERRNMFKPGFTTKTSEHSGLGLAIVSDLARDYGGVVSILPNELEVIIFEVVLPIEARARLPLSAR